MLSQQWPSVDDNFNIPLKVRLQGRTAFSIPILGGRQAASNLTEEEALRMVLKSELWRSHDGAGEILSSKLFIVPLFKAELEILVKGKSKKVKKSKKEKLHRVKS